MLDKHKVVVNLVLNLGLSPSFLRVCRNDLSTAVNLFVKTHHFLEGIPPPLDITSITTSFVGIAIFTLAFFFVAQISQTLFKDVVPMTKIFWSQSFKIIWTTVLFVVHELAAHEKQVEYFGARINGITVAYLINLQRLR